MSTGSGGGATVGVRADAEDAGGAEDAGEDAGEGAEAEEVATTGAEEALRGIGVMAVEEEVGGRAGFGGVAAGVDAGVVFSCGWSWK